MLPNSGICDVIVVEISADGLQNQISDFFGALGSNRTRNDTLLMSPLSLLSFNTLKKLFGSKP